MKHLVALLILLTNLQLSAQESYGLEIEESSISNLPGLQSFVWAQQGSKYLFIGGRTEGLHKRRPFEAFLAAGNNTMAYVFEPSTGSLTSASLSSLGIEIFEQLQSTNMEFEQLGNELYIAGGYAYSTRAADHITFDKMTIVDVSGLIAAIENNQSLTSYFSQIQDSLFEVTGGYLDYMNGSFYLVGGQSFMGQYNPMGPTHGPGFVQKYTEEIRKFQIEKVGANYQLKNVQVDKDPQALHRRDYNMAPQKFPNGEMGFTAFSGVFQHQVDLPWLDVVDITSSSYTQRNDFEQLLSQYHSAHLTMYDASDSSNKTIFFGGIAQFSMDQSGQLIEDQDVPFVRTISQVNRNSANELSELNHSIQMPDLLGAGAEFLPLNNSSFYDTYEMLQIDALPNERTLVGYIFGGIQSTAPNVFFNNAANVSSASTRLFEVYINKSINGQTELIDQSKQSSLRVFPNPSSGKIQIQSESPKLMGGSLIRLTNIAGKLVLEEYIDFTGTVDLDLSSYPKGIYFLQVGNADSAVSWKKVVLK